ncbi:MAG: YciI family protein [Byssovorax sp.]
MRRPALFIFCLAALAGCASQPKCPSADNAAPPALPAPTASAPAKSDDFQMEAYAFVILRRGPAWTPEKTDATEALQKQHIGHLQAMAKAGKLVVAGPFDEQPDETMRGLCLYRTSLAEARALAEQDPAVKAGRLRVEVMTWWTEKGALTFPIAAEMAKGKPSAPP